jgi:hypothetical protein
MCHRNRPSDCDMAGSGSDFDISGSKAEMESSHVHMRRDCFAAARPWIYRDEDWKLSGGGKTSKSCMITRWQTRSFLYRTER